ncbi:hypothetical protein HMPREF1978_01423 [Actinomyces graevenitzii F0530]|uniref:Uncharacterized protein n=1 Tax=Actinomyces graevenitzii F0530 TaxID=1321817 RepID=U1PE24_9ACTO|nr:hypothetical protein HMPREF1978_01423 [Actinomyces graevenitzii F0530]
MDRPARLRRAAACAEAGLAWSGGPAARLAPELARPETAQQTGH